MEGDSERGAAGPEESRSAAGGEGDLERYPQAPAGMQGLGRPQAAWMAEEPPTHERPGDPGTAGETPSGTGRDAPRSAPYGESPSTIPGAGRGGLRLLRLRARAGRMLASKWAPRIALLVIVAFSLAAKAYDLAQPCSAPCTAKSKHTLIFDEAYYVNAARVIAGINPPKRSHYHGAPLGDDPNAEHPQLAKAIMAGTIELFGNDPVGWRIGSILFGLIALLALYALVRAAGGSTWLAVGTVGVASLDNLMLVHSRIGTLDIYAVAMMLVAGALYMRERPLLAGLALGVAGCMKEVALSLVFVFVLLEALRVARVWLRGEGGLAAAAGAPSDAHAQGGVLAGAGALAAAGGSRARAALLSARRRGGRLLLFSVSGAVAFLGLLWLLDVLIPAYDPGTHKVYAGNPIAHFIHMYKYAVLLTSKPDETGFASHPLAWLLNEKAINYASTVVNTLVSGKITGSRTIISFQGLMNPFIIFLAIPATFAALATAWRGDDLAALGACWVLGTYLPFLFGDLASNRISYLYYMLIVMPGLYIVTVKLFANRRMPRAAALGWAIALIYGFIHLYPFRTLL